MSRFKPVNTCFGVGSRSIGFIWIQLQAQIYLAFGSRSGFYSGLAPSLGLPGVWLQVQVQEQDPLKRILKLPAIPPEELSAILPKQKKNVSIFMVKIISHPWTNRGEMLRFHLFDFNRVQIYVSTIFNFTELA